MTQSTPHNEAPPGPPGAPDAAAISKPALRRRPAGRAPKAWILLLCVVVVGLSLDLASKSWFFDLAPPRGLGPVAIDRALVLSDERYDPLAGFHHRRTDLLPWRLLDARLVVNHGAVFGVGQRKRWFFMAFTFCAIGVAVVLFARWTREHHRLAHVAVGLIVAGGFGNLYDRARYGVVRDFLHILPDANLPFGWRWHNGSTELFPWVFNVADVMLLTGMMLIIIHINRLDARRNERAAAEGQKVAPG